MLASGAAGWVFFLFLFFRHFLETLESVRFVNDGDITSVIYPSENESLWGYLLFSGSDIRLITYHILIIMMRCIWRWWFLCIHLPLIFAIAIFWSIFAT